MFLQVTPEMSAEAQANFGGGWRTPSSAEHLFVKKNLPKETPYGIDGNKLYHTLCFVGFFFGFRATEKARKKIFAKI